MNLGRCVKGWQWGMIGDEGRLGEVIEEIAEWDLAKRRRLIAQIEAAQGTSAAGQIRDALTNFWKERR